MYPGSTLKAALRSDAQRHKVFISYHHADQTEVDKFVNTFDKEKDVFIARGIGFEMSDDIINSDDPDYVMRKIRELYLKDSTVTIVLVGKCTWARRYVDWEIQSSLRHGDSTTPNGLLGIVLPSVKTNPLAPNRLKLNLGEGEDSPGYAQWYYYPDTTQTLAKLIDLAFAARTNLAHLIQNPRERFSYNKTCE